MRARVVDQAPHKELEPYKEQDKWMGGPTAWKLKKDLEDPRFQWQGPPADFSDALSGSAGDGWMQRLFSGKDFRRELNGAVVDANSFYGTPNGFF